MDTGSVLTLLCAFCGKPAPEGTRGSPKQYCSIVCRRAAFAAKPHRCPLCKAMHEPEARDA